MNEIEMKREICKKVSSDVMRRYVRPTMNKLISQGLIDLDKENIRESLYEMFEDWIDIACNDTFFATIKKISRLDKEENNE